jgi:S-formylglutathione hydrolase FrmB
MKLNALGIPHERDLTTTGGGHSFDYYNQMAPQAIGFLADRLEREDRRVV